MHTEFGLEVCGFNEENNELCGFNEETSNTMKHSIMFGRWTKGPQQRQGFLAEPQLSSHISRVAHIADWRWENPQDGLWGLWYL